MTSSPPPQPDSGSTSEPSAVDAPATPTPRALITGVGGQDGSYLAERLIREGYDVHGLALPDDPIPELAGLTVHRGDLIDADGLHGLIVGIAPHEIYNLAAMSSIAACWAQPQRCAQVNGAAVATVLDAAWQVQESEGRAVRVVQASSAAMFGDPGRGPLNEATRLAPVSPYGAAKAYAHLLCGTYRNRGLHCAGAILFNHESPRRPRHFVTRKIAAGVAAIARGEAETLTLGNLDAVRDWGWAPDYVDAMIRMARAERPDDYVIATGVGHSVRDFVEAAFAAAGIDTWQHFVLVDDALRPPGDSRALIGDPIRAQTELGWQTTKKFDQLVRAMVANELA